MSVATLTPRIRETLGVSNAYDAVIIPAAIRRAAAGLLRDYNFPKSIMLFEYTNMVAGAKSFTLPNGFKLPLLVQIYDPVEKTWTDALERLQGFGRPVDGQPRGYWLQGDELVFDQELPAEGAGLTLQLYYQSMAVEDNEDWLLEDFEDILFTATCYRQAVELRKPDIGTAFSSLWQQDQRSLAIYANELEFSGLHIMQRARKWDNSCWDGRCRAGAITPPIVPGLNYIEQLPGITLGQNVSLAAAQANAVALNIAAASGLTYTFYPNGGTWLEVAGCVKNWVSNSKIIWKGFGPLPTIYMRKEFFNLNTPTLRNTDAASLFRIWSPGEDVPPTLSGIEFDGFAIESDPEQGRFLQALSVQNVKDFKLKNMTFRTIPTGYAINAGSLTGHWQISYNTFLDFYDNSTAWPIGRIQTTCILLDDDRTSGVSSPGRINFNYAFNIQQGEDLQQNQAVGGSPGVYRMETDFINIGIYSSAGHVMIGNMVDGVGEAFDIFGKDCIGVGNKARNVFGYGLKFPHGANNNIFYDTEIDGVGLGGVVFTTSSNLEPQSFGCRMVGGSIKRIGYTGRFPGAACGIVFALDAGVGFTQPKHCGADNVTIYLDEAAACGIKGSLPAGVSENLENHFTGMSFIGTPSEAKVEFYPDANGKTVGTATLRGVEGSFIQIDPTEDPSTRAFHFRPAIDYAGLPTTHKIGRLMFMQNIGGQPGSALMLDNGTKWIMPNAVAGTVQDRGDADGGIGVAGPRLNIWNSPLTANRAVGLSAVGAAIDDEMHIVRTAAATGAFNLTLLHGPGAALAKVLVPGSWARVRFVAAGYWVLIAAGTL